MSVGEQPPLKRLVVGGFERVFVEGFLGVPVVGRLLVAQVVPEGKRA